MVVYTRSINFDSPTCTQESSIFNPLESILVVSACAIMPVRIRLSLRGCTNRPFYHIVVAPSRFKRGGRHLEQVTDVTLGSQEKNIGMLYLQVGSFDPMPNYNNEKLVALNIDRIK